MTPRPPNPFLEVVIPLESEELKSAFESIKAQLDLPAFIADPSDAYLEIVKEAA